MQKNMLQKSTELLTGDFMRTLGHLCFVEDNLSSDMWQQLVPALWAGFTKQQRDNLAHEVTPFLASGIHLTQVQYQTLDLDWYIGYCRVQFVSNIIGQYYSK